MNGDADQGLLKQLDEYKMLLKCSSCVKNFKDHTLLKCGHTFWFVDFNIVNHVLTISTTRARESARLAVLHSGGKTLSKYICDKKCAIEVKFLSTEMQVSFQTF